MKNLMFIVIGASIGALAVLVFFSPQPAKPLGPISPPKNNGIVSSSEKELLEIGQTSLFNCDYNNALEVHKQFEQKYPKSSRVDEAIFWTAYSLKELKLYKEAISKYEQLVNNHPKSKWTPDAEYNIAAIYETNLKDYNKAIELYDKISAKYPDSDLNQKSLYRNAQIQERQNDYKNACDNYNKLWNQQESYQTNKIKTNYCREQARRRLDFIEAHSDFDRKPLALYNDAENLKNDGKHLEAASRLKTLLKEYPTASLAEDALISLIQIYRIKGPATEAQDSLNQLKEKFPNSKFLTDIK